MGKPSGKRMKEKMAKIAKIGPLVKTLKQKLIDDGAILVGNDNAFDAMIRQLSETDAAYKIQYDNNWVIKKKLYKKNKWVTLNFQANTYAECIAYLKERIARAKFSKSPSYLNKKADPFHHVSDARDKPDPVRKK